jgi:hypothetical protein
MARTSKAPWPNKPFGHPRMADRTVRIMMSVRTFKRFAYLPRPARLIPFAVLPHHGEGDGVPQDVKQTVCSNWQPILNQRLHLEQARRCLASKLSGPRALVDGFDLVNLTRHHAHDDF